MGQPAAKQGDQVVATDTHIVMIPSPGGPVPTPLPNPFVGQLDGSLSSDVNIDGQAGRGARARPPRTRRRTSRRAGRFRCRRRTRATIQLGSGTVLINGKPAARNGDTAMTCNDPSDLPVGQVVAVSTVLIGG